MTVQELYNELGKEIEQGHGDLRVIANADIDLPYDCNKGEEIELYLMNLKDVYYQSGDIELSFSRSSEK